MDILHTFLIQDLQSSPLVGQDPANYRFSPFSNDIWHDVVRQTCLLIKTVNITKKRSFSNNCQC